MFVGVLLVGTAHAQAPTTQLESQLTEAQAAFDEAQKIQADQPDRARQLFRSAAQGFESLVAAGIVNGRLEFNLANCYLQSGDVGQAVLHYKRAKRLIPRDPLLTDNLTEARSQIVTTIRPTRRSAVWRGVFFWHHDTSLAGRCRLALVIYVAFWALLAVRCFALGRGATRGALACGFLMAALFGSITYERWSDQHTPEGVVTAMDVGVYKGPGGGYQRRFEQPLQPGVEFTRQERRGGWWHIELPDGKRGWIESHSADLVHPTQPALTLSG